MLVEIEVTGYVNYDLLPQVQKAFLKVATCDILVAPKEIRFFFILSLPRRHSLKRF